MGLFDIFSKKKPETQETELRREFEVFQADFVKLCHQVDVINGRLNVLYQNVSVIAEKKDDSGIRQEVQAVQAKMKELLTFARLSIQNHDDIKEIKRKMIVDAPKITAQSQDKIAAEPLKQMSTREKEIIGILLNAEMPLSNSEIASRLGISAITVKGHINSIKKRYGGIVVDISKGKNKKDYQLDRSFRLKVLEGHIS